MVEMIEKISEIKNENQNIPMVAIGINYIYKNIKSEYEKVMAISEKFPIVEIDTTLTKKMKANNGNIVEMPLLFHTNLPANKTTSIFVNDKFTITSDTPYPTTKTIELLKTHKNDFDGFELWWVPKDIIMEEVKPDPILVGYINYKYLGKTYFELTRWIDESTEEIY